MPKVAINGAAGRMGRRLVALAMQDEQLTVAAALEHSGHELCGKDAGVVAGAGSADVQIGDGLRGEVDVMIDFSAPAATEAAIDLCCSRGVALVIGTTGLGAEHHEAVDRAAEKIAVLQAPNMSLGVNLLFALAGQVAQRLGEDYDIEIVESHHRFKKDSPSGTALGIAEAICSATGRDMQKDVVHGRCGADVPRTPGQIGMHALRQGDVVGRHTVSFAAAGEELQLTHNATTRDVFALGALRAAKWLAGKTAGRYRMADVLGL